LYAGFPAELVLIDGIDKEESSVQDAIVGALEDAFELLQRQTGVSYLYELFDGLVVFLQYEFIQPDGQQVIIRHLGEDLIGAYLLVTAEWHLPGGEAKEYCAMGEKEGMQLMEQFGLVMDVLDDIFEDDEIEPAAEVLFDVYIINIADDIGEPAICQLGAQPFATVDDTLLHQFHSDADAAFVDKGF